jgi:hypothetical protein
LRNALAVRESPGEAFIRQESWYSLTRFKGQIEVRTQTFKKIKAALVHPMVTKPEGPARPIE